MLRTAATVLALGAVVAVPAPAPATPNDSEFIGRCSLLAASDPTYQFAPIDSVTGVLHAEILVYSPTADRNPVLASVTCTLKVNGIVRETVSSGAPSTTLVVAADRVSYGRSPNDFIEVCTTVASTDAFGQTKTVTGCYASTVVQVPPQEVIDLVEWIPRDYVKPLVCPFLALLYPFRIEDHLRVDPDGDVVLFGNPIWDCEPYGNSDTTVTIEVGP